MTDRHSIIPLQSSTRARDPVFLTPKEAAGILRVSVGTLEVWRRTGAQDLDFYRRGRNIFYDRMDLYNFMRKRKISS